MNIEELKNKKVLITFHTNSDIDAVASAYALQNVIKNAVIAQFGRMDFDSKVFLKYYNKNPEKWEDINIENFEYIIALDGQSTVMFPHLKNIKIDLIIDHHDFSTDKINAKEEIIEKDAKATCEVLYKLLKEYMNSELAEMLLCGIISDTLRFKQVDNETFYICSELQKNINASYEKLIEISLPRLPKEECVGFFKAGETFKYVIENEMVIATAKAPSYTGSISTVLSETVADVVFVTAPSEKNSVIKLSGRTWIGCGVDITKVIKILGKKFNSIGGGHPYAAGMDFQVNPNEIDEKQDEILEECIKISKEFIKNK